MNNQAVAEVTGAMPMLIPADPRLLSVDELIEACAGFLLTGGRPNVHPEPYGDEPTETHGAFDRDRDAITLPLIRDCVARGVAVPRHLPRLSGVQRRDRRHAPPRNPQICPAG